jgi:hypothetical protein
MSSNNDELSSGRSPVDALDMELVLSNSSSFPIEDFSKRYEIKIPCVITKNKDSAGMMYYFYEGSADRDLGIFLKTYGARYEDRIYTLYASSSKYGEYNFLKNIWDIPSVVPDISYVSEGVHYFHFRFHNSVSDQISDLLISPNRPKDLVIERMAKYYDIRNSIGWFIETYRPYVFEVLFRNDRNYVIDKDINIEVKGITTSGKSRGIFYGGGTNIQNAVQIDGELVEGDVEFEFLDSIYGKYNGVRIPVYSNLLSVDHSRVCSRIIIPEMYKRNLISRLGSEKYKVYEPEIRRVEMYENITECDFPEIIEN